jgi:hypothetical protein
MANKGLILFALLLIAGCGDKSTSTTIVGDQISITDSQVIQSCSTLKNTSGIDCGEPDTKLNCEMCFSDSFREDLDVNVEGCIVQLTELGHCGE